METPKKKPDYERSDIGFHVEREQRERAEYVAAIEARKNGTAIPARIIERVATKIKNKNLLTNEEELIRGGNSSAIDTKIEALKNADAEKLKKREAEELAAEQAANPGVVQVPQLNSPIPPKVEPAPVVEKPLTRKEALEAARGGATGETKQEYANKDALRAQRQVADAIEKTEKTLEKGVYKVGGVTIHLDAEGNIKEEQKRVTKKKESAEDVAEHKKNVEKAQEEYAKLKELQGALQKPESKEIIDLLETKGGLEGIKKSLAKKESGSRALKERFGDLEVLNDLPRFFAKRLEDARTAKKKGLEEKKANEKKIEALSKKIDHRQREINLLAEIIKDETSVKHKKGAKSSEGKFTTKQGLGRKVGQKTYVFDEMVLDLQKLEAAQNTDAVEMAILEEQRRAFSAMNPEKIILRSKDQPRIEKKEQEDPRIEAVTELIQEIEEAKVRMLELHKIIAEEKITPVVEIEKTVPVAPEFPIIEQIHTMNSIVHDHIGEPTEKETDINNPELQAFLNEMQTFQEEVTGNEETWMDEKDGIVNTPKGSKNMHWKNKESRIYGLINTARNFIEISKNKLQEIKDRLNNQNIPKWEMLNAMDPSVREIFSEDFNNLQSIYPEVGVYDNPVDNIFSSNEHTVRYTESGYTIRLKNWREGRNEDGDYDLSNLKDPKVKFDVIDPENNPVVGAVDVSYEEATQQMLQIAKIYQGHIVEKIEQANTPAKNNAAIENAVEEIKNAKETYEQNTEWYQERYDNNEANLVSVSEAEFKLEVGMVFENLLDKNNPKGFLTTINSYAGNIKETTDSDGTTELLLTYPISVAKKRTLRTAKKDTGTVTLKIVMKNGIYLIEQKVSGIEKDLSEKISDVTKLLGPALIDIYGGKEKKKPQNLEYKNGEITLQLKESELEAA